MAENMLLKIEKGKNWGYWLFPTWIYFWSSL